MMTGSADAHSAFSNIQTKTANPSLVGWVTRASFKVAKDTELVASEYSRLRIAREGYSSRITADNVQSFTVTSIESPYTIYETYPPSIDVNPAKVRCQKERMRNHAKWQVPVQLERNNGCRHEVSGGATVARVPLG